MDPFLVPELNLFSVFLLKGQIFPRYFVCFIVKEYCSTSICKSQYLSVKEIEVARSMLRKVFQQVWKIEFVVDDCRV